MQLAIPVLKSTRLVKDRILHVWEQRRAEANERTTEQERRVKGIQQKLDRLDEAFLYSESIDLTSYGRQPAAASWVDVRRGRDVAHLMAKHVMSRRVIVIVLGLRVGIALGSRIPATRVGRTAAASPRAISPSVPVSVATVARADVPVTLSALGAVTAFNTVTVRPRVDGQLMRVAFREGQFVKQGDLLAQIDPRPFQVQLEQAEGQLARDQAQLANAQVDLTRYPVTARRYAAAVQLVRALGGGVAAKLTGTAHLLVETEIPTSQG